MARVIVSKYGMKWYSRECTTNKIGEQGETEGIMRWLLGQGHEVIYFGAHEGEVDGVTFIRPHLDGLDAESSDRHQRELWTKDIEQLADLHVTHAVQVNGMAPTFSWIDNPRGARLQSFAVRMCGPWLNVLQTLRLPRVCVNNDPRSYPRDQEMSYGWNHCRPSALLDQCSAIKKMTVGGLDYRRVSVYGVCESYGYLPVRLNTGEMNCVVIAHNHANDSIASKSDWSSLHELLKLMPEIKIYGNGWEVDDVNFMGPILPHQVLKEFSRAKTCFYVPHTPGFKTGKPYVATSCGCVPCTSLADVLFAINNYEYAIHEAQVLYQPDFSMLRGVLFEGTYGGGYENGNITVG
jgi:hypothetical protein